MNLWCPCLLSSSCRSISSGRTLDPQSGASQRHGHSSHHLKNNFYKGEKRLRGQIGESHMKHLAYKIWRNSWGLLPDWHTLVSHTWSLSKAQGLARWLSSQKAPALHTEFNPQDSRGRERENWLPEKIVLGIGIDWVMPLCLLAWASYCLYTVGNKNLHFYCMYMLCALCEPGICRGQ